MFKLISAARHQVKKQDGGLPESLRPPLLRGVNTGLVDYQKDRDRISVEGS